MVTEKRLDGTIIFLRQIELSDCGTSYVEWLNDPKVNQYLETRWVNQDLESIKSFVVDQRENTHSVLFAIVLKENGLHIGNIKIGPINRHHLYADVSYFIGEKSFWHRGIATEAIQLVCGFGFHELNLRKITAGAYSAAIGSWKALEKNGFIREGVFREQVFSNGEYMDVYRYGLLSDEYKN